MRVSMCYLAASRTTCLHSSCHTRCLQWIFVLLLARSFLFHAIMLTVIVLSIPTSLLHLCVSSMNLYCKWPHLWRTKCNSDCHQAFHLSYNYMTLPIHRYRYKWMVLSLVNLDWIYPLPRKTTMEYPLLCMKWLQVHTVYLCIECTSLE